MAPPPPEGDEFAAAEASLLSTVHDVGHGREVLPYAPEGVPLLRSFQFSFRNGDHEIREIGVMPVAENDTLGVTFMDKNGDDAYDYRVRHYDYLGPVVEGLARGSCSRGGSCQTEIPRPADPENYRFVIVGYHFGYWYGDHEVRQIAVRETGGTLYVTFADQNGDDPYSYSVRYAYVPWRSFAHHGSRRVTDYGATGRSVEDGSPPVLSAFSMYFWEGDNELESVAIELNGDGTMDVDFSDENPGNTGFSFVLHARDFYTIDVSYSIVEPTWVIPPVMMYTF